MSLSYPRMFPERVHYKPVHPRGVRGKSWPRQRVGGGHLSQGQNVRSCVKIDIKLRQNVNTGIVRNNVLLGTHWQLIICFRSFLDMIYFSKQAEWKISCLTSSKIDQCKIDFITKVYAGICKNILLENNLKHIMY